MVGARTCVTGLVVALAAGCGGSGEGEINRESIASCLREANFVVSTNPADAFSFNLDSAVSEPVWKREGLVASIRDNDVALLAVTGKGVSVTGGSDEAGLAFSVAEMGLEEQEAKDLLKRYGNVVVEWSETPTDEETQTLQGCVA
jgi:hypothetical protein